MRGGSGSKLAHVVAGRINFLAGGRTEGLTQFLAPWTSPQESSQHSGWLPSEPTSKWEKEERWKPEPFCNPVLEVTSHHFCCVLFLSHLHSGRVNYPRTWGPGGRDHWGLISCCLPQTPLSTGIVSCCLGTFLSRKSVLTPWYRLQGRGATLGWVHKPKVWMNNSCFHSRRSQKAPDIRSCSCFIFMALIGLYFEWLSWIFSFLYSIGNTLILGFLLFCYPHRIPPTMSLCRPLWFQIGQTF